MTTENTIFMYKNGYILLEDLEDWYARGFVTRKDKITIFEPFSKKPCTYKISLLIKIYGSQYPFRRIPRPYEYDPLTGISSGEEYDSESDHECTSRTTSRPSSPQGHLPPKRVGGAFGARTSTEGGPPQWGERAENPWPAPVPILHNTMDSSSGHLPPGPPGRIMGNASYDFRDYPLYNVYDEPEVDRITGLDVITEMEKLRSMLPINCKWSQARFDYFFFLHRKNFNNGRKPSVAICRLCNVTPFGGQLFMKHLFHKQHIQKLSTYSISRLSFQYWSEHFKKATELSESSVADVPTPLETPTVSECSDVTGTPPLFFVFQKIPLFQSNTSTEKRRLEPEEIAELTSFTSRLDFNRLRDKESYLKFFYKYAECSMHCDICRQDISEKTSKFTKHILIQKHLKGLTGVSQKEVNFWINFLNIDIAYGRTRSLDITRILGNRNPRPIPLLDFKIESLLLKENARLPRLEELKLLYKSIKTGTTSSQNSPVMLGSTGAQLHENAACFACDLPKNSFKNHSELVDHIFSDGHLEFLLQFGFSEKAFVWWKKYFDDILKQTPVQMKATVMSVRVRSVQPEPVNPQNFENNPRVPLLDREVDGMKKANQRVFCQNMRTIVTSLYIAGKEVAEKNIVNWTCAYCSTVEVPVKMMNELQTFNHIVSQKHLEKMKFTAPIEDLTYWIKWAVNINPSSAPQKTSKKPSEIEKSAQKTVEARATSEEPSTSGVSANNPRVPMLDPMPADMKYVVDKNKLYAYLSKYQRKFQRADDFYLDTARSVHVRWQCYFCKESSGKSVQLPNMLYAFNHVVSHRHWENMKHTTSSEDLTYWKEWAQSIFSCKLEDLFEDSENIEDSQNFEDLNAVTVMKFFLQEIMPKIHYQREFQNTPRVPLLDEVPLHERAVVTHYEFNKILNECKEIWKNGGKKMEIAKKSIISWNCPFCSTSSRKVALSNEQDSFLHILKDGHRENMGYAATLADLMYWKKWVTELSEKVKNEAPPPQKPLIRQAQLVVPNVTSPIQNETNPAKPIVVNSNVRPQCGTIPDSPAVSRSTPVSVVAPVQFTAPSLPQICTLPLFSARPTTRKPTDTVCIGPTIQQIEIVTKTVIREFAPLLLMFEMPTKCGYCNIDMSRWPLLNTAQHAFSVSHLNKLETRDVVFYREDFQWWIQKITFAPFLRVPTIQSQLPNYYLGGLKPISSYLNSTIPIFVALTPEETNLIINIDEAKLQQPNLMPFVLKKFGCCVYCNKWFLKPMDAIHHFVSDFHIRKVTEYHPVKRTDIDEVMNYVKISQKEKSKCNIM